MRHLTWLLTAALLGGFVGCQSEDARFRQNMALKRKVERTTMTGENGAPTELSPQVTQQVADVLAALFGTPDVPQLPIVEGIDNSQIADMKRLRMAAGRVSSDQDGRPHGLYREHCVHCHGISGDGAGPTAAFLNPYPRDYRLGLYKFKSTKVGEKPTHDDLKKILLNGIAGTAMPSFALLSDYEIEALIDYVKYLSIRGEMERRLFTHAVEMEDPFDTMYGEYTTLVDKVTELERGGATGQVGDAQDRLSTALRNLRRIRPNLDEYQVEPSEEPVEPLDATAAQQLATEVADGLKALEAGLVAYQPPQLFSTRTAEGTPRPDDEIKTQLAEFVGYAGEIMQKWIGQQSTPIPSPVEYDPQGEVVQNDEGEPIEIQLDPNDKQSLARGKAIFYGTVANCFSCHGESGLGDGQRDFYDAWSGEWVEKDKPEATEEYVALGALPPRNLIPRNLRSGVYRGGRRPIDLYWRITNGIDGAQMPAAPMLTESDPPGAKKLSQRDVWDLINYVQSLPYESISQPSEVQPQLAKEIH